MNLDMPSHCPKDFDMQAIRLVPGLTARCTKCMTQQEDLATRRPGPATTASCYCGSTSCWCGRKQPTKTDLALHLRTAVASTSTANACYSTDMLAHRKQSPGDQ